MNGFTTNIKLMFKYMGLTIISPYKAFKQLKEEPHQVAISMYAFFFMFIVYTGVLIIGGIFTRVKSFLPLLINIFPDDYYLYIAIIMPFIIVMNLVLYSMVEVGAIICKKKADFRFNLALVTMAITIPWWAGFFCDATVITGAIITGFHNIPYWCLAVIDFAYGVMALGTIILVPVAIFVSKGMNQKQSIIIGLIGLVIYWGLMSLLVL
jgi:hypothetical protein